MKTPAAIISQFARPLGTIGLAVISLGSLATSSPNTFFEVTVRPGSSVVCASSPCTVYFETPAGSGTHNILQNGTVKAGVAIGGQRVLLGVCAAEDREISQQNFDPTESRRIDDRRSRKGKGTPKIARFFGCQLLPRRLLGQGLLRQKAARLQLAPCLPILNGGRPTVNSSSTRPSLEPSSQTNSSLR